MTTQPKKCYWLMKSEPESFSIDALEKSPKQTTFWDGVRNYQVRNMLRDQMRPGDLAFFYHSNCTPPGIIGVMEIMSIGYPDATAFDAENHHYDPKSSRDNPRWYGVDVRFKQKFGQLISLDMLRQQPVLNSMKVLQTGSRLSITPVTEEEWEFILSFRHCEERSDAAIHF
jgi:predicted RNA-binding protein with PUA-like domain